MIEKHIRGAKMRSLQKSWIEHVCGVTPNTACIHTSPREDDPVTLEISAVAVGQEFTVRLTSTPTTGYVWEVQKLPESIQLLGSDYEKPAGDIQPGNPMTRGFRFQARKAGEYIITFVLKRQWESNAIESYTVTVQAS